MLRIFLNVLVCSTLLLIGCEGTKNKLESNDALSEGGNESSNVEREELMEERDWTLYEKEIVVDVLESRADRSKLLTEMGPNYFLLEPNTLENLVAVTVDETQTKQEFYGYGAALTHASAQVIGRSAHKEDILKSLFSKEEGIGLSVIRLCIGASDFVGEVYGKQYHYTYNDLEAGEEDLELKEFSIAPDEEYIIPLLKEILAINPNVKLVAAPWSAPAWMKTTERLDGGSLKDEYLDVYARYLIKFIEAYATHDLSVDYLSVQNEPLHATTGYPTMKMSASQQANLIGKHLGPLLSEAGIETKIIGWDHNYSDANQPTDEEDIAKYGLSLLGDKTASPYVSGIAFHGYEANGLADFSKAFDKINHLYPTTELFFTEISGGGWSKDFSANFKWNMHNIMVGLPNHQAQMILLWNLALDELDGPHLGGCGNCRGVYTTSTDGENAKKEVEYYALGQVSSKVHATDDGNPFVISVNSSDERIEAVGFVMPDGEIVITLYNNASQSIKTQIIWNNLSLPYKLMPGAAVTFSWSNH